MQAIWLPVPYGPHVIITSLQWKFHSCGTPTQSELFSQSSSDTKHSYHDTIQTSLAAGPRAAPVNDGGEGFPPVTLAGLMFLQNGSTVWSQHGSSCCPLPNYCRTAPNFNESRLFKQSPVKFTRSRQHGASTSSSYDPGCKLRAFGASIHYANRMKSKACTLVPHRCTRYRCTRYLCFDAILLFTRLYAVVYITRRLALSPCLAPICNLIQPLDYRLQPIGKGLKARRRIR